MIKYFLLLLIALPIASAAEVDLRLYKDKYSAGETLQVDININKMPLNEFDLDSINFVDSDNNEVKIAPFFHKIRENKYYLYFDLPTKGEFKLRVNNFLYKEDNLIAKNFETNVSVDESSPILAVKPAFLFDDDFLEIELESKKGDTKVVVSTSTEIKNVYCGEQEILEGRSRFFNFKILNKLKNDSSIIFSYSNKSYSIPIFVKEIAGKIEESNVKFSLVEEIKKVEKKLNNSESLEGPLKIKNTAGKDIQINFELNGNVKEITRMNYSSFLLKQNEIMTQYFWVNKNKNAKPGFYNGNLTIKSENYQVNIPMTLNIADEKEINDNYAEDLNKDIFNKTEDNQFDQGKDFFEENATYYKDESEKTGIGSLLIMILVIILAFIVYIFTRKKTKHEKFEDYVKGIERK